MSRRGFTFIELVTVWAIICILAAILFPVFARAREKGRQASCLNNLINVGAALRMYATDNWGSLPPTDNDLMPIVSPRYLPEIASLRCPSLYDPRLVSYPPPTPDQVAGAYQGIDYVCRGGLGDDDAPNQGIAADRMRDVHNSGCNVLFLDGHVKWTQRRVLAPDEEQSSGYLAPPGEKPIAGLAELRQLQDAFTRSGHGYVRPPDQPPPDDGGGRL